MLDGIYEKCGGCEYNRECFLRKQAGELECLKEKDEITKLREENKRLKEENEEYKLRLYKAADFVIPYRNGFNNWFEFLIEDKCKLLEILNGEKLDGKENN